jgi:hypothetical protein
MTDTTKYVAEALAELELVKSEASLMGWHDANMATIEYTYELSPEEVRQLEQAYQQKAAWLWGVGA